MKIMKRTAAASEKGAEYRGWFTQGSKGCLGVGEEGFFTLPAYQVEVVDTVGAGDVFTEHSLRGSCRDIQQRKPPVLPAPYRRSNVRGIGGRAGIPDWETVREFMETGRIDYREIEERIQYYKRGLC